jgi:DnaJ family protein A protein 2
MGPVKPEQDMDLYATLGVERSASADDIKQAYRKASLKAHPDRPGGDTKTFQALQGAYDVLSDQQKRAHYDATGSTAEQPDMPDLSAMFGGMFGGGFNPFGGGLGPQHSAKPAQGPHKLHEIGLTLADLYKGKQLTLNIKREVVCRKCRLESCQVCKGRGVIVRGQQMGPFMTMVQEPCGPCKGEGTTTVGKCGECGGRRLLEKEVALQVEIEPGMGEGDRIVFAGQCSESPAFERPGDVILVIRAATTDTWIRTGSDLSVEVELSIAESLLGWERTLDHPSGEPLVVTWKEVVRHGDTVTVAGKGMPIRGLIGTGDLHVVCRVRAESFTDEQRKALLLVWPREKV